MEDSRHFKVPRRGRRGGRRRRQLGFDPLESRQLLAISAPVAEFPMRTLGGTPEGAVQDPSGNEWVLLSPGNIAEISNSGGVVAQYQIPTYDPLGGAPAGSELGLITYNAVDGDLWFYETGSDKLGMLNPTSGAITEYPALFFSSNPAIYQIAAGPDGNIWFTEPDLNEIGMFDISTDLVSQFTMPMVDTQPQGITAGPDGNMWFTEGGLNQLGSINPVTHVINNYAYEPPGYTTNDQAEGITAGPNGTIWFVEVQNNQVMEFNIASQAFTAFAPAVPTPPPNPIPPAKLWSIGQGPDGDIYYTEQTFDAIGDLNPTTGANLCIQAVTPPQEPPQPVPNLTTALVAPDQTAGSYVFVTVPSTDEAINIQVPATVKAGLTAANLPATTVADDVNDVVSVGNDLYETDTTDFNSSYNGSIEEFNPATQLSTLYPLPIFPQMNPEPNPPPAQLPEEMAVDSSGNIWFTENAFNVIGEFDPTTGGFTQTFLTAASSQPTAIAWDEIENELWMTEPGSNQIVNFNPTTTGSAVAPVTIPDPVGVLVDPATGYLWITEGSADKIIEYSPVNEHILYTYNTTGSPSNLIWGPDGNIWFTEAGGPTGGLVGILTPGTGLVNEIQVSGAANALAVGPSTGTYTNTIWFTETGSNQIGEIDVSTQSVVGYATAPDTDANAITLGPDGNEWFTSGQATPAMMGAVVLNPADLGTQVVVTTQPPNVEQTIFGGFTWGFGLSVAVENSAGDIDPFVQMGTLTLTLSSNPGDDTLEGTLALPVDDGVANFGGLTLTKPANGYVIQATYSLGLNAPMTNSFYVAGQPSKLAVMTQPPADVQAGVDFGLTIVAEDSNGFVVPTFDDPIELSISTNPNGDGVLTGTNPFGALYGSAAFDALTIDQVGNGYVLQAEDISPGTTVTGVLTSSFDVTAGPASQLVFTQAGEPVSTAVAGTNFADPSNLVVDAEDQFGNINTTYDGPVTIALAHNATGTFVGTLTVDAVNGVATFTNLEIDTVGTYQLEVTSGSLTDAVSTSITIAPATAAQLVWVTEPPAKVTEGFALGATLDVEDQYGNLVTGYNQNVSVALYLNAVLDNNALGGTDTVAASGGVVTFSNIIINAIGDPFTLVATSGNLTSAPAPSPPNGNGIDVIAPQLVVTSQPTGSVTAGDGFSLTFTAETVQGAVDPNFNGTMLLTIFSGPAGSTLNGTTSAVASSGVATFSGVILDTAGAYVLEASSGNLIPGYTSVITVVAQTTAAHLYIVDEPPASVQAGAGFGFEVGAVDQFGNPTNLTGSVSVAILNNPGGSTLGGVTTVGASGGVAVFSNLTLNKVGDDYTLQASDSNSMLGTVTTSGIDVTLAPPTQLVFPADGEPPASVAAGQEFSVAVDVDDAFGNVDTNYTGSVTLAQPSNLIGTTTASVVNGVATFSGLVIDTAGTYQIQATSVGLTSATSTSFTVTVAASGPTQLVWVTEPPSSVFHCVGFAATLDVEDQYGNLDTAYNGIVDVALDNNPGDTTLVGGTLNASGGVAAFSGLTINVVDSGYTLVATTTTTGGDVITSPVSTAINVTTIPATGLEVSTQPPTTVQVAQSFGLTVTVVDQFGTADPDFNGSVSVALASDPATILQTVNASAGIATFSGLTLNTVGSQTLQVSSAGLSSVTTNPINVTAAAASQLVLITDPPATLTAGTPFGFEVEAEDPYGNLATSFDGGLTAALSPNAGNATLGGAVTATASDGVAFFAGLAVDQAGDGYTIHVTSSSLTPVTTTAFSVTPAAAAELIIPTQPPTSVTAGDTFGFPVAVADAYGNVEPSFSGSVTIALSNNPDGGVLNGAFTVAATNGIATFSGLSIDLAVAGYTIEATSGSLIPVTTTPIDVTPAAPTKLEVLVQPPPYMVAGADFGLGIVAEDVYGNRATQFTGNVSIALLNDPSGAVLSGGPLTVAATAGVANFQANFTTLDMAQSGYTIQATSNGLAPVTTGVITVTPAPATHLVVLSEPPAFVTAGSGFGFVVAAEDPYGNINATFDGTVSVSPAGATGVSLGGTTSVTASNGVATFNDLVLGQINNPVSLLVSATGLSSTTTSPLNENTAQFAFAVGSESVDENAGDATIQVVRSGAYQGTVSVNVATSGGTAVPGVNYTAINQTLNFAAGQNSETITIPVKNVGVLPSTLTFGIVLSSPGDGATLGSPSTATINILNVGQSTQPGPLVTMESLQVVKKKHQVKEIILTFSGALNATEAASTSEYTLTQAGKKGSFTAKSAKAIKLLSAAYNSANDTVTLTPKKKFVLSKPVQLVVHGEPPSGLEDSYGRLIDGNDNGQAGSNAVAVLTSKGATISVLSGGSAAVDLLVEHGELAALAKARKS